MSTEVAQQSRFDKFIQNHNEDYIIKCRELGQKNEYVIESNGKPITFIRKRLTTRQFNDLELERNRTEKDTPPTDSMEYANLTATMYFKTAQAYLNNKETGQPMTKEEYENCIWEDIKIILDACHLRTIMGAGNSAPASKT